MLQSQIIADFQCRSSGRTPRFFLKPRLLWLLPVGNMCCLGLKRKTLCLILLKLLGKWWQSCNPTWQLTVTIGTNTYCFTDNIAENVVTRTH